MHVTQISDYKHWLYDPTLYGLDDDIFKNISGVTECINGKIRVRASVDGTSGRTNTTTLIMMGRIILNMTIEDAPAAGHSKVFGLYSRAYGNHNAAYFFISGKNFYVRTYDDKDPATVEQTTVLWNTDWNVGNPSIQFEIRWTIDKIEFYIDGVRKATHTNHIPKQVLLPLYFSNGDRDNIMWVNWIRV